MKNILMIPAVFAAILLTLTGCASMGGTEKKPDTAPEILQEQDRIKMREEAIARGMAMLQAVQNKDYAGFTQYFPEDVKKKFTPQAFSQFDTYIGKLEKWEYLTEMLNPITTTYLWKTTVRRKNAQGKEITINLLFQLAMAKKDGQYVIVGSWFR